MGINYNINTTNQAFSDDSSDRGGQFHSLSVISGSADMFDNLEEEYLRILEDSGIGTEFKWKNLQGAKYRFVAEKIIDLMFFNKEFLRIDTITWDLNDSRHKSIIGRDDKENLVRMYYHLMSTVLSKHWPIENTYWEWYPDRQSCVDWNALGDCLKNRNHSCLKSLFNDTASFQKVNLKFFNPSDSSEKSLIQIADLFAGIGCSSKGQFERFNLWKNDLSRQLSLLNSPVSLSNSEKNRYPIFQKLSQKCKEEGMSVSLKGSRGFETHRSSDFINFWMYRPQTNRDRAPIR